MRSALLIAAVLLATTSARAEIAWRANLKSAHDEATASGKLILVHFYADNCVWCDRLEQGTFQDPAVAAAIEAQFVPVKINGTREPKFANAFSISRYPTDVIVASDGSVLTHQISPQDTSRYLAMLSAPAVSGRIAKESDPLSASGSVAVTPKAAPGHPAPQYTTAQAPAPQSANFRTGSGRTLDASPVAVADGAFGSPATAKPNPQVAGPGPKMAGFALPPGITAGNFEMHAFGGTPAIAVGHRGAGTSASMGLAAPANATSAISQLATERATAANSPVSGNPHAAQPLPPEAMDGYCPVTMITETRWAQGKPEYGVIHLGHLYLFATAEAQRKFQASPEQYTPVLNGMDVVKFFEERKVVPGCREWGYTDPMHGRMFFFADEASMNHFYEHHERYVEPAIELTKRAAADANRRR